MSREDSRAKDLRRTLVYNGFKRDRSETKTYSYEGRLRAAGRGTKIAVTFSDLEFTRLPELTLLNPDQEAPHVVAHLGTSGTLCFARNEDYVLDRYDVGGTALMCLMLASQGLERALTHKHLEKEIAQEFPQHWLGQACYYDIAARTHVSAKLYHIPRYHPEGCYLLTDREGALKRLVPDEVKRKSIAASALRAYVFYTGDDLTFKRNFRQPHTLEDFFAWLESIIPDARERAMNEMTHKFPDNPAPLFIYAPNGCVGISIDSSIPAIRSAQRRQGLKRIICNNEDTIRVQRYSGTRIDLPFIFGRNMSMHSPLAGRKIALVGCGTIGSHLAKLLVQSGAGHADGSLLLLDNQTLEPGNVGRHFLGTTSIGESKAVALKEDLVQRYPEANMLPMFMDVVRFYDSLANYDLVIDATGEEALSISINHYFVQRRIKFKEAPDVIHARLFGNGAAAQVLLVDGSEFACFKCLKPDHEGSWRFNPVKPDFTPTLTPAACGETQFVAYGVAAPAMAAALALQIALDWNSGSQSPRMRTLRIEENATVDVRNKNPDRSPRCPACGGQAT